MCTCVCERERERESGSVSWVRLAVGKFFCHLKKENGNKSKKGKKLKTLGECVRVCACTNVCVCVCDGLCVHRRGCSLAECRLRIVLPRGKSM